MMVPRSNRCRWKQFAAMAAGSSLSLASGSLNAGRVAVDLGDGGSRLVVGPAIPAQQQGRQDRAVTVGQLLPASLPVTVHPAPFSLLGQDSRVAASFAYTNGSRAELAGSTYEIADAKDASFFLRLRGGAASGPFSYQDASQVRLGQQIYKIKIAAPFIRCRLSLADIPMPRVRLALLPLRNEAVARLARLRAAYGRIKQEVACETAPFQLDAPAVYGLPGFRRDTQIERSAADTARAESAADGRARQAFEQFLGGRETSAVTVPRQSEYTFRDLPSGLYAICIIADVRLATGAHSYRAVPLVWWATVGISEREAAFVSFEQDQGQNWRTLFPD